MNDKDKKILMLEYLIVLNSLKTADCTMEQTLHEIEINDIEGVPKFDQKVLESVHNNIVTAEQLLSGYIDIE